MRKIVSSVIFLAMLACMTACEDKVESAELNVDPELIHFTAEGGYDYFTITSSTDWIIKTDEPNIWIQPREGSSGTTRVKVSVSATKSTISKYCILMVQTKDGSTTKNVRVEQAGVLSDGATLSVGNHSNYLLFGGKAKDTDSLLIVSNGAWQIMGPDWLEIQVPETGYKPLSQTVPVNGSGSMTLLIRTNSDWTEEYDHEGSITLRELYEGNLEVQLSVVQLGRRRVQPNLMVPQTNCLATSWKSGLDVAGFVFQLSTEVHVGTTPDFSQWTNSTHPDYINSWVDLTPNTTYYIGTVGYDANNEVFSIHDLGVVTRSEENMALASITNMYYDGTQWLWDVTPDENTNVYYIWGTPYGLSYNDAIMGWYFQYFLNKPDYGGETIIQRNEATQWQLECSTDYQVMTWAVPHGTDVPAGRISRAKGTLSSSTKAETPWEAYTIGNGPRVDQAVPIGELRTAKSRFFPIK